MAIDLSKLSDEDLDALEKGDLTRLSDAALAMLEGGAQPSAPPVEPISKGPSARRGPRRPGAELRDPGFFARKVQMRPDEYGERFGAEPEVGPSLAEVGRKGKAVALGVPGGAVRMTRGVAELGGETETSRQLKELEESIARRTSETEAYEAGRIIPEILPFTATAAALSKVPVASRLGMGALQTAGQAGTAYAVSPENRGEAALMTGLLGAFGEAAVPAYQFGRNAITRARQLLSTTGPVGATPAEEAAVRIAREKAPGKEQAEAELAAAREAERVKQEEAARLKAKYLEGEKARLAQKADLERRQIEAKDERVRVKSDADKAVAEAAAKRDAAKENVQDRIQQIREQQQNSQNVLEETNMREAAADAKPILEERASEFRNLARQLKEEADAAKAVTVELPPVRPKQSRAEEFRQLILDRRDKLKRDREEAIGRDVDPITGQVQEAPFLKTALTKEDAGQTISASPKFRSLVGFVRERAEDASRYGDEVRRAHSKLLNELQPVKETVDENGEVLEQVIPIKFEKLWEERRRISEARSGQTATGYEAITDKTREGLLKTIDDALDDFGSGYKDFNKKYTESSRPLDEFNFGVGEKATETRKFSRGTFVSNPETVLDTALSKPSQSSAQQLKASFFDEKDYDKLDNIVFESLTEKAGNTPKGYESVLKTYGEFLKEFPAANQALRRQSDEVAVAFGEGKKTAAFKERWAKRVEARADKAEKAINSISGLQAQVKSSLTSPLKEGSLDQIGAFVRSNPKVREKVGAALTDVLNSMDDKLIEQSLSVPERQAAFLRAGMNRDQIDSVLTNARSRLEERANNLAEVKAMRSEVRQAQKETKAAQAAAKEQNEAAAEKVRQTGRELQKADEGKKAEELAVQQANAEFSATRALRVDAQTKRRALGELTPDMRDAINIEAEKIPLNTTEGLARATTLATILGGVGSIASGSILGGMIAAGGAAAAGAGRRIYIKSQQKRISDEIESIVSKILKDDTGGVVSAIEKKIERANDVAAAQRIANKALTQFGYKPGVGAVTSSVIYNAYAKEPEAEGETEEEPESVGEEAPEAPKEPAEAYSYEALNSDQIAKVGQYLERYGLNKNFLMNAQTFNATPIEKRKKLFDLLASNMMAEGGLVTPGNIDVSKLPAVRNPDGTVSTVRSMSVNINGKEVLIPTVINGRVVSEEEAIQSYLKTGRHLGMFSSPEAATAYGKSLSAQEAQRVQKARGGYTLQEELLLKRYANR